MTDTELQDLSRAAAAKLPRGIAFQTGDLTGQVPWSSTSGTSGGPRWLYESNEACAEIMVRVLAAKYLHYEVCGVDDLAGCYYFDASADGIGSFDASETEDQGNLMLTWRVATLRALVVMP